MSFFGRILRFIRKKLFIPVNVCLIIADFSLRKWILGFSNAILYLERIDKHAIIPLLKLNGAAIGNNCDIETGLVFHNCNNLTNLEIGDNCHIGKQCFFDLKDRIIIEENCVISMRCNFITHIDMNKSELKANYPANQKKILIKSNCYLGINSTILMGNVIGKNSIIAANSLVTKDVTPNTLNAGIPSKKIKQL